jgi:thioredoxin-related protein
MKRCFCLLALCIAVTTAHAANWLTDLSAAQAEAQRQNKPLLVNFTGSDWCGWCIKLRQEVFSQPEFDSFAAKNLVLVEVDFPKNTPQSDAIKKANAALASRFHVSGFPTVVILTPQGQEIARTGYQPGGVKPFVQTLAQAISVTPPTGSTPDAPTNVSIPAKPAAPMFNGARSVPVPVYTNLVVKSISGTRDHRFALVNNQTFAPGDSLRVKMNDSSVLVRCVEIRERSVVMVVDGQEREITLASSRP